MSYECYDDDVRKSAHFSDVNVYREYELVDDSKWDTELRVWMPWAPDAVAHAWARTEVRIAVVVLLALRRRHISSLCGFPLELVCRTMELLTAASCGNTIGKLSNVSAVPTRNGGMRATVLRAVVGSDGVHDLLLSAPSVGWKMCHVDNLHTGRRRQLEIVVPGHTDCRNVVYHPCPTVVGLVAIQMLPSMIADEALLIYDWRGTPFGTPKVVAHRACPTLVSENLRFTDDGLADDANRCGLCIESIKWDADGCSLTVRSSYCYGETGTTRTHWCEHRISLQM